MKYIISTLIILIIIKTGNAQGCSDAGICSIDFSGESSKTVLSIQQSFGLHDTDGTSIFKTSLSGKINAFGMFAFVELPFYYTQGKLGSLSGVGDIMLSFGIPYHDFIFNLGFKIPTNDANKLDGKNPLPMAYQTSQATTDLLLVINYKYKSYKFSSGYQHILSNNNNNEYFNLNEGNTYSSINIRRGNDIFLSAKREFAFEKIGYLLGFNTIYRLQKSIVVSPNILNSHPFIEEPEKYKVSDSQGLTLNLIGSINYQIDNKNIIVLDLGLPLNFRKDIRDGLKRVFEANLKFNYSF